jgi:hypothetical protein
LVFSSILIVPNPDAFGKHGLRKLVPVQIRLEVLAAAVLALHGRYYQHKQFSLSSSKSNFPCQLLAPLLRLAH